MSYTLSGPYGWNLSSSVLKRKDLEEREYRRYKNEEQEKYNSLVEDLRVEMLSQKRTWTFCGPVT